MAAPVPRTRNPFRPSAPDRGPWLEGRGSARTCRSQVRTAFLAHIGLAAVLTAAAADAQGSDPFDVLRSLGSAPAAVPARAIATIPERHVGRLVRVTDELELIRPPDELARAVGLNSAVAIQIRTRDLGVPVFVQKTDATITTVLGLRLGAPIELTGVLVERGPRYLFLASDVRPSATAASPAPPSGAPPASAGRR